MPQQPSSSKKTIVIIIIIIVLAVLAYFYFSGNPSASQSDTLEQSGGEQLSQEAEIAGARVLALLNQISSLKIDVSIFNDPVYKSLVDYSIEIPEQKIGRVNPFAPLPGFIETIPKVKK